MTRKRAQPAPKRGASEAAAALASPPTRDTPDAIVSACAGILAAVRTAENELRRVADPFLDLAQKRRVTEAGLIAGGLASMAGTSAAVDRRTFAVATAMSEPAGQAVSVQEVEALVHHQVQMGLEQLGRERSADLRDVVEKSVRRVAAGQEGRLLEVLTRNLTESLRTLEAQLGDRLNDLLPPSGGPVEFSPEELEEVRGDDAEGSRPRSGHGTVEVIEEIEVQDVAALSASLDLDGAASEGADAAAGDAEASPLAPPWTEQEEAAAEAEAVLAEYAAAEAARAYGADGGEADGGESGDPGASEIDVRRASGANTELLDAIEDVRTLDVQVDGSFALEGFAEVIKGEAMTEDTDDLPAFGEDEPVALGEEGAAGDDEMAVEVTIGGDDEGMYSPGALDEVIVSLPGEAIEIGGGLEEVGGFAGGGFAPPAGDEPIVVDLGGGEGLGEVPSEALQTADDLASEVRSLDGEDEGGDSFDLPPASAAAPSPEEVDTVNRYLELAADLRVRKNYPAALEVYGKVLEIDPRSFDAYVGRGVLYLETADLKRAATEFRKAQHVDPDAPEAYMGLGEIHFVHKEYTRAVKCFSKSLSLDENLADAYYKRGLSHYHERAHKKAFLDLNKAYKLDPELPHIKKYLQMVMKQLRPGS